MTGTTFEVVEKDIVGRITTDAYGGIGIEVQWIFGHFYRVYGGLNVQAINAADAINACEVQAGLGQCCVEICIVRAGREQIRLRLIVDVRDFADSQAVDRVAIECVTVGHQVGGLVTDAAVEMHATVVAGKRVIVGTRHRVGIAISGRIGHVANDADVARQIFANQPAHRRRIVADLVGKIDEFAPDV